MILLIAIDFRGDIDYLRDQIGTRFHSKVDVSINGLDPKPFLNPDRNQFNSTSIIQRLEKDAPSTASKVLAVTSLDLYIPILTFVFGEARLNGQCAVVSSYRLDNRSYGLPDNPSLLQERLLKESIHELGHTFGLIHCQNPDCVMKSSTYVEEIDFKSSRFCLACMDSCATALSRLK
ncbi:MAG: archaemetzincin [Syntrophobacteraceae bacterium]|nr:archaemetzincin [Syntrophobacteraceae bacterium]